MKKKAVANQKLMRALNRRRTSSLKEPLTIAVAEVADLRAQLKDREKARLSLRNAKARLQLLESQLATLHGEHAGTATEYANVEKERDAPLQLVRASVKQIQQKTDFRNIVLDQKLGNMESSLERRQSAGYADRRRCKPRPDRDGEGRGIARDTPLHAQSAHQGPRIRPRARATKSYNARALRSFAQKLSDLGIPASEVDDMGFVPIPTGRRDWAGTPGCQGRRASAELARPQAPRSPVAGGRGRAAAPGSARVARMTSRSRRKEGAANAAGRARFRPYIRRWRWPTAGFERRGCCFFWCVALRPSIPLLRSLSLALSLFLTQRVIRAHLRNLAAARSATARALGGHRRGRGDPRARDRGRSAAHVTPLRREAKRSARRRPPAGAGAGTSWRGCVAAARRQPPPEPCR